MKTLGNLAKNRIKTIYMGRRSKTTVIRLNPQQLKRFSVKKRISPKTMDIKGMSRTCQLSKFDGASPSDNLSLDLITISYVNCAARFISAVWALRRRLGPTGNIMAIEHCLQRSLQSWKMSRKRQYNSSMMYEMFKPEWAVKILNFFEGRRLPLLALI